MKYTRGIETLYKDRAITIPTYMVPPALSKVGQVHLKCVLEELKADTENSEQKPVPDD